MAHTYGGIRTINGKPADLAVRGRPGRRVRVRVVNTDNAPMEIWASRPYRLLAVDGNDVHGPTPVEGKSITVTAGGRADLEVTMPADGSGVRVQLSRGDRGVVVGRSRRAACPHPRSRRGSGPARLRYRSSRPDSDPREGGPALRLRRSAGCPASSGAGRACGGRSTDASIPTSRCTWSGRASRRPCGSTTEAARCTPCTCTATRRWCCPATAWRPPAARGGWTP